MRLPKADFKVQVGPFEYEVKYSKDISNEGNCFGSTHNDEQKIFIQPDLKKQKLEQTFVHELLHAINFVSGLWYRINEDKDGKITEEEFTRTTSMLFYQVMRENPHIF